MFQFFNLVDCRWSGDRPCPIVNCPEADDDIPENEQDCPAREEQVLDLAQLLIRAEPSGAFKEAAFGDGEVPVMAIPARMRGEESYPSCSLNPETGGPVEGCSFIDNGYRFHSFFAVTEALFTKTFFVDYKINEFRENSDDECFIPTMPPSEADLIIPYINETANLILYNSGDAFGTVNRGYPEGTRGGVINNSFCNGGGLRARWSANTIGLEYHSEDDPFLYVDEASRMISELRQAKDELACLPFPSDGGTLGPLLSQKDCVAIEDDLKQVEAKFETCVDALTFPREGASEENCNAFFSQADNLRASLERADWPDPSMLMPPLDLNDPEVLKFKPNYEGEILARFETLLFFVQSYVLNSAPAEGFPPR
jgi:hypothetical protein